MAKKFSFQEEILQKISRLEKAYSKFSEEINYLRKELKKIGEQILKKVEEEKISKIRKQL